MQSNHHVPNLFMAQRLVNRCCFGCMAMVGFKERHVDQLINKWNGLIRDYKKNQGLSRGHQFRGLVGHE